MKITLMFIIMMLVCTSLFAKWEYDFERHKYVYESEKIMHCDEDPIMGGFNCQEM